METFDENHAESVLEAMAGTNARNEEHARTAWNKFAFLTMPEGKIERAAAECACRVAEYLETKGGDV